MSPRTAFVATLVALTAAVLAGPAIAATDPQRYRVISVVGHRIVEHDGESLSLRTQHRFKRDRPYVIEFGYGADFSVPIKGRYHLSATIPDVLTCEKTDVFGGDDAVLQGQWQGRNRLVVGVTVGADDDCGPMTSASIVPLGGAIGTVRLTRDEALRKTLRLTARTQESDPLDGSMTETVDMRVTIHLKAI